MLYLFAVCLHATGLQGLYYQIHTIPDHKTQQTCINQEWNEKKTKKGEKKRGAAGDGGV